MKEILSLIFSHPDATIRRLACSIMIEATDNNNFSQTFAQKLGALYLTQHIEKEQDPAMKEAVLSSLFSLLKGENYEGRRSFILDYQGLALVERLFLQNLPYSFHLKTLQVLYDLLYNQAQIFK